MVTLLQPRCMCHSSSLFTPPRLDHSLMSCLWPSANNTWAVLQQAGLGGLWSRGRQAIPMNQYRLCSGIIRRPGDNHRFCSETVIHHNEDHKASELFIREMELLVQSCPNGHVRNQNTNKYSRAIFEASWPIGYIGGALKEEGRGVNTWRKIYTTLWSPGLIPLPSL